MSTFRRSSAALARAAVCTVLLPLGGLAQEGVVVTQKSVYDLGRIGSGDLTQTFLIRGADRQKVVTTGRARFLVLSRDASGTEIVRLDEGRIYRVDHRRRQFHTASFAELRPELDRMQRQAEAAAAEIRRDDLRLWFEREPVVRTGQQRTINGFATEQVVLRATVMGENPRTGERGAVFHLTAELWIDPTQRQVARLTQAFARSHAAQLGLDVRTVGNPYARWIAELSQDIARLEGYPIHSLLTLEAAGEAPRADAPPPAPQPPSTGAPDPNAGTLLGGAFRRTGRPRGSADAHDPASPGRRLLFRVNTEVLTISVAAPEAAEFEVPAGYRSR